MYAYTYILAGFDDGICWIAEEFRSVEGLLMALNTWEYYADEFECIEVSEWKVFDDSFDDIPF
jgi:hypothetical protein